MIRVRRHSVRGSARPSEPAALPVAPPRIRPTRDGAPDFAGEHPAELRTAGRVRTDGRGSAGTAADSNTSRPRSRRACGRSDVRTAGAAPEPRPTCGGAPDFAGEHRPGSGRLEHLRTAAAVIRGRRHSVRGSARPSEPAALPVAPPPIRPTRDGAPDFAGRTPCRVAQRSGRVRTDGQRRADVDHPGTAADSNTSRPRSRRACGRSDVRTAGAAPEPRPTCGGAPDFAGEHRPGSGRLEHLHGRGRDPRAAARDRGRFRNGASRPDWTAAGRPEELRTAGRVRGATASEALHGHPSLPPYP